MKVVISAHIEFSNENNTLKWIFKVKKRHLLHLKINECQNI